MQALAFGGGSIHARWWLAVRVVVARIIRIGPVAQVQIVEQMHLPIAQPRAVRGNRVAASSHARCQVTPTHLANIHAALSATPVSWHLLARACLAYSMKEMPMADEASRQQVLDGYRIVDSLPEDTYQDVVQVAASLCGTPIALMSLVDRDRQWFKAQLGLGMQQTDRSQAVCDHAIRSPEHLMEVHDLTKDTRFADVSVVTGETGARFYAGMPLVTSDGVALGTVCVLDTEPRTLTEIQRTGLQALARVTMRLLDERKRELQLEREAILQPVAPVAIQASAETGYYLVILEVQELAALVEKQSERLLGRALQQLDQALAAHVQASGDSVDRVTESAEFIAVLRGPDAAQKLQGLREIAQQQHALGLTVLIGEAQATRGDEPIGQVFLRAEVELSIEKDRYRQSLV